MKKTRKHYTAQGKVAILRRHLVDKEPVSKLCDELALQPTVFYRWQKEFFENGAAAFQTNNRHGRQPEQERIERLEKKIRTKDEVLAELMAEHIALKKGNSGFVVGEHGFDPGAAASTVLTAGTCIAHCAFGLRMRTSGASVLRRR